MERIANKYAYWVVVLIFGFGLFLNSNFQHRVAHANGKGYDGQTYYAIAEQMTHNLTIETRAPFVYRLATPFLASLLPFDILTNFQLVNLSATLIGCLLLLYWLSLFFEKKSTALWLTVFLMTSWTFYVRQVQYSPATCDPMAFVLVLLLLILLLKIREHKKKLHLLLFGVLIFTGVFFREFLIVFSVGLLFIEQPFDSAKLFYIDFQKLFKGLIWFLLSLTLGLTALYMTHQIGKPSDNFFSFKFALIGWLNDKSVFEYMNGMFNSFGPGIVLILFFWKRVKAYFANHHEHIVLVGIGLLICWFTGGDTERFFMWFAPLILIPLGLALEQCLAFDNSKIVWVPLVLAMVLVFRVFWPIPHIDVANPTDHFPILQASQNNAVNLLSYHGKHIVTYFVLVEHLLIAAYLYFACRSLVLKTEQKEEVLAN